MADKTTGELQGVPVGSLPVAPDIYDETLIPVEQQGEARHMTGAQWKAYGVAAAKAEADRAEEAAVHQPIIQNGTWWLWDKEQNEYVDSGTIAEGPQGETGVGIAKIELSGLDFDSNATPPVFTKTYTITMTDGSTFSFSIKDGQPGPAGEDGANGVSSIINGIFSTGETTEEGVVYYLDVTVGAHPNYYKFVVPFGPKGETGSNIQSIDRTAGTGASGTTDTYTVTLTDGSTTTFQVYNGKDGGIPIPERAEVGQIIQVAAVDGNGKPTAWAVVDMPKGEVTADALSLTINPTDGKIYITVNGVMVGQGVTAGPPASFGDVQVDNLILKLNNDQSVTFNVRLSEPPTNPQVVTILSDNEHITFDKSKLTFTAENYDTYQTVTASAANVTEDGTAQIIIRNSDELLTDTNITVYLKAESYNVDTTIPEEDMHTVTPEDFKAVYASSSTGELSLGAYSGTYTNLYIPETMEYNGVSYKPRLAQETTFKNNTTVQYVTIHPAVSFGEISAGAKADGDATALFSGATSLIGVKYRGDAITILNGAFNGCSNLKFFDGLELQKQNTTLYTTFKGCTSIEYVQDMSDMTGVTNAQQAFDGCTSLKKCYGIPNSDVITTMRMMFYNCTALESEIEIRGGVPNTSYCFSGCTSLKTVKVYAESITDAGQMFERCSGVTCYLPEGTVSYSTISAAYGNSADVTIAYLGGDTVPTISCWGDSTTSTGTDGLAWPARLQAKLGDGILVKNMAISGEYSTSTSCRQGGNQAHLLEAVTIPADTTAVNVTLVSADGQTFGTAPVLSTGANYNPVTIAGVRGSVAVSSGQASFVRMNVGEAVEVPAGTAVVSENAVERKNDEVQIIYLGTNSGWDEDPETLLAQVQSMVDYYGGSNYIIMGQTGGKHMRDEESRAITFAYEEMAAATFGNHWLNLREYLIENSLTENGLTATEQDTERRALGQIPWSILMGSNTEGGTDDVHYNTYGLQSVCNAVYAKGVALGYWT